MLRANLVTVALLCIILIKMPEEMPNIFLRSFFPSLIVLCNPVLIHVCTLSYPEAFEGFVVPILMKGLQLIVAESYSGGAPRSYL